MRHFQSGGVPVTQEFSICLENQYFGHIVTCSSITGADDSIQQDKTFVLYISANQCKQVNYSITKHLLVLSGNAVCINIKQKINYHNNLVELINLCNVAFFFS